MPVSYTHLDVYKRQAAFRDSGMHFIRVNAQQHFMERLAGVEEPERKRKIIGEEFIRVFEAESKKIGHVDFLAQGDVYKRQAISWPRV